MFPIFRMRPMTFVCGIGGGIAGAWLFEGIWPIVLGVAIGIVVGAIIDRRSIHSAS